MNREQIERKELDLVIRNLVFLFLIMTHQYWMVRYVVVFEYQNW